MQRFTLDEMGLEFLPFLAGSSAADGTFKIDDLALGATMVEARSPRHASSQAWPLSEPTGQELPVRDQLRLVLGSQLGSIAGRVRMPDGGPGAGALVVVGGGGLGCPNYVRLPDGRAGGTQGPVLLTADVDGRFEATGLAPGTWNVQARAAGTGCWSGAPLVKAGERVALDFKLTPQVTLDGVVRDQEGRPVAGASVWFGFPSTLLGARTLSGRDGTYRLHGLSFGTVQVSAGKPGVGVAGEAFAATPGQDLAWDPRLVVPGVTLRGRVVGSDKTPRPGLLVVVSTHFRTTSGRDGAFELVGCPAGRIGVAVLAADSALPVWRSQELYSDRGPLEIVVRDEAMPSARMRGSVVDGAGKPIANAKVKLVQAPGMSSLEGASDASGRFDLGPCPPAGYALSVQAGPNRELHLPPRDLAVDERLDLGSLVIREPGTLVVRVRNEEPRHDYGGPRVRGRDGSDWGWVTMQNGVGKATNLQQGSYVLTMPFWLLGAVPVEVRDGAETEAEIVIPKSATLSVRIERAPGDPSRTVKLRCLDALGIPLGEREAERPEESEAWHEIPVRYTGTGRYTLEATTAKGSRAVRVVDLEALPDAGTVTLRLR